MCAQAYAGYSCAGCKQAAGLDPKNDAKVLCAACGGTHRVWVGPRGARAENGPQGRPEDSSTGAAARATSTQAGRYEYLVRPWIPTGKSEQAPDELEGWLNRWGAAGYRLTLSFRSLAYIDTRETGPEVFVFEREIRDETQD